MLILLQVMRNLIVEKLLPEYLPHKLLKNVVT